MSGTHRDKKKYLYKKSGEFMFPWDINFKILFGDGIDSAWKKLRRKQRRAKENDALRNNKIIPIFKKCDEWDWY